jgi:hypothetical protein
LNACRPRGCDETGMAVIYFQPEKNFQFQLIFAVDFRDSANQ